MKPGFAIALALVALLAGCEGVQSALSPAGRGAVELLDLFRILLIGAAVIWVALNGLFLFATMTRPGRHARSLGEALIIGGGVLLPTAGLAALLTHTLPLLSELRPSDAPPAIRVSGEQWWWRVTYLTPDGPIAAANEIRLPAGRRTALALDSAKVIHSFWVPSLAGKMDMFPGRVTRLSLEPLRAGVFRGQCAELCGVGHALMAFPAVVMEPAAYDRWLMAQAAPAAEPADDRARHGRDVFFAQGCGACHTVRGTPAQGNVGPDLTHVGGRRTIGAGMLPTSVESFRRWVGHTQEIKPGVKMPSYGDLDPEALDDLAHFLNGLK